MIQNQISTKQSISYRAWEKNQDSGFCFSSFSSAPHLSFFFNGWFYSGQHSFRDAFLVITRHILDSRKIINMKKQLNIVIPLFFFTQTCKSGTKISVNVELKRAKHFMLSCLQIRKTIQLSGASLPPITGAMMLSLHDKREMGACFFIRDLSVSRLSSHNKSPALS